MNLDINKICIMIDNASGDEGLLKEISDYFYPNKKRYCVSHCLFIHEHLTEALENIEKKSCPTAEYFK